MKIQKICKVPFTNIELYSNGDITPCCRSWIYNYDFGNIFDTPYEHIWNSDKAKEFRRSILDGSYRYCNMERCCGLTEFPQNSPFPSEYCTPLPEYVKYAHDRHCNIACVICRSHHLTNTQEETQRLDALIESHLLPLCRDAKVADLCGSGEVFASSHAKKLLRRLAESYPSLRFDIHTNALLCTEKNCADLGILDKIRYISASIHAATQKTYEKIAVGSDFAKVMENMAWLASRKKTYKIEYITGNFVVSSVNYHEMEMFAEKMLSLGISASFWELYNHYEGVKKSYSTLSVSSPENDNFYDLARMLDKDIFQHHDVLLSPRLRDIRDKKLCPEIYIEGIYDKNISLCSRKISRKGCLSERKIPFSYSPFPNKYKTSIIFPTGILKYQKHTLCALLSMAQINNLSNKRILEIGGDSSLGVAKTLHSLCGRQVTVVNPNPALDDGVLNDGKVRVLQLSVEDISPTEKFDCILGIAVLEHFAHPDKVFQACHNLLNPGGILLLQGGPLWYASTGHHLFMTIDDTTKYTFGIRQHNPVDNFSHLYLSPWQMRQELAKKRIKTHHITKILDQIYYDPHINRLTSENIINTFKEGNWDKICIERDISSPGTSIQRRIAMRHPDKVACEFAYSLYITAMKPTPDKMESPSCENCGSTASVLVYADIASCCDCGFVYSKSRLSRFGLHDYYQKRYADYMLTPDSLLSRAKAGEREFFNASLQSDMDMLLSVYRRTPEQLAGSTFVDIGCGWGRLLLAAQHLGMKANGYEWEKEQIEVGNMLGLDVAYENFLDDAIEADSVSFFWLSHSFCRLPPPHNYLKKMYISCKSGALVYCTVPNWSSYIHEQLRGQWDWLHPTTHFFHFTLDILRNMYIAAGFEIIGTGSYMDMSDTSANYKAAANDARLSSKDASGIQSFLTDLNEKGKGDTVWLLARKI